MRLGTALGYRGDTTPPQLQLGNELPSLRNPLPLEREQLPQQHHRTIRAPVHAHLVIPSEILLVMPRQVGP